MALNRTVDQVILLVIAVAVWVAYYVLGGSWQSAASWAPTLLLVAVILGGGWAAVFRRSRNSRR